MAKLFSPTTIGDKRMLHVYLDVGDIGSTTRYFKLATINRSDGILHVNGILGGRTPDQGRGFVDISISARDGVSVIGVVSGTLNASDLIVFVPTDSTLPIEVWLSIKTYGLANLELAGAGGVDLVYNSTYSSSLPSSGTSYYLSSTYMSGVLRFPYSLINSPTYNLITVNYSLGSGVTVVNSGYFTLYAMPMFVVGNILDLFINPVITYGGSESGFRGEGLIYLSISLGAAFKRMGINYVSNIYTYTSAAFTAFHKTSSSGENGYFITDMSWNSGVQTLSISIFRNLFNYNYANLPTGIVRCVFY